MQELHCYINGKIIFATHYFARKTTKIMTLKKVWWVEKICFALFQSRR